MSLEIEKSSICKEQKCKIYLALMVLSISVFVRSRRYHVLVLNVHHASFCNSVLEIDEFEQKVIDADNILLLYLYRIYTLDTSFAQLYYNNKTETNPTSLLSVVKE